MKSSRVLLAVMLLAAVVAFLITKCSTTHAAYRLGDMVRSKHKRRAWLGRRYHLQQYPDSITSKYLRRTNKASDMSVLSDIVSERTTQQLTPPSSTLVVHIRTGDVIERSVENGDVQGLYAGSRKKTNVFSWMILGPVMERVRDEAYYQAGIDYFKQFPIDRVILVTRAHLATGTDMSYHYINLVQETFRKHFSRVELRLGQAPDDDFIYMCNSSYFLAGGGNFSSLIHDVVQSRQHKVFPV